MSTIRQDDLIDSVADALQFISYYHPADYIANLYRAYEKEQSAAARDAMAQILINSRMCAEGHRPICQDTGIVNVFLKVGMSVRWDATQSVEDMVNAGVRRAYLHPDNKLRASVLADPAGTRTNTRDNTPAVVHVSLVQGDTVEVEVAAKGGGSENKAKFVMLNPSDSIVDWVLKTVPAMGAGWCPPGILGIGIGGTAEKAMVMAKEALMEPIDMQELMARGANSRIEELRIELYEKVNALGIGAQGLGGLTTVLDVKIRDYPTHAASLPVAMIPNCAATRHVHFTLDGSGPARLEPPSLEDWPSLTYDFSKGRRVFLDSLTRAEVGTWKPGEVLLLNGRILTGRDAAHKRLVDMLARGEKLPVDFTNRLIYYVGPVDPGTRRGRRSRRSHDRHAHGQIHPHHAGEDRAGRDDRQGRAWPCGDRGDTRPQGRLPDGRRRRRLSGVQSDQSSPRGGLPGPRHGSHLRVRGERHAGDRCSRQRRQLRPQYGTRRVAGEDRKNSRGAGVRPARGEESKRLEVVETSARPSLKRDRWRVALLASRLTPHASRLSISMAGLPALQGSESGQVRKEAATAITCKCRGLGSPPYRSGGADEARPPQRALPIRA